MRKSVDRSLIGLFALTCAGLVACSSGEAPPTPSENVLLAPPPEGQGYQYTMTTKLEPGTEAEHCKFVVAPPEGMLVNRDEVRFTQGSHHFLLYETAYTSIPTAKDDGAPVDTSGVFDCSDGPTNGFTVTKLVAGSQNGRGEAFLRYPSDVALRVEPGRVLLMNTHYINASSEAIEPEVRVNLYTIPSSQLKTEGDILFWYNAFIKVEGKSTGRARMRCEVHDDITLMNIQSHMHARGKGYAAAIQGKEPFYTNEKWEDVPVAHFDGGMAIEAGTTIDYFCDYANPAETDVYQGPRSTDEMCMLIGSYYPKRDLTSRCAVPAVPNSSLGAEWVGNGTATCAESFSCVQSSFKSMNSLQEMTTCMIASDPKVSKELSDAVRCQVLNFGDAATKCAAQFDACKSK